MSLLNKLLHFVLILSKQYNIDETHSISHSLNVLNFAHNILESEKRRNPSLENQELIIYVSAAIHDMCDKKYINQDEGLGRIEEFLDGKLEEFEINSIKSIISTMSYSTVKKNGFPELGDLQHAYHIVREADLLSAYDFDRCMLYNIHKQVDVDKSSELKLYDAYTNAHDLFQNRVLRHYKDGLFITEYSKSHYLPLQIESVRRMNSWSSIMKKPFL
jgi:hypothetical protein